MQGNGRRPLAGLPLALGGIVAGHALAYALAYPIRAVRDAHLEDAATDLRSHLHLGGLDLPRNTDAVGRSILAARGRKHGQQEYSAMAEG